MLDEPRTIHAHLLTSQPTARARTRFTDRKTVAEVPLTGRTFGLASIFTIQETV
jgi:hypothetical protein